MSKISKCLSMIVQDSRNQQSTGVSISLCWVQFGFLCSYFVHPPYIRTWSLNSNDYNALRLCTILLHFACTCGNKVFYGHRIEHKLFVCVHPDIKGLYPPPPPLSTQHHYAYNIYMPPPLPVIQHHYLYMPPPPSHTIPLPIHAPPPPKHAIMLLPIHIHFR